MVAQGSEKEKGEASLLKPGPRNPRMSFLLHSVDQSKS